MNFRSQLLMLGLALCALLSCKRSTTNDPGPVADTVKIATGVDIYLIGASSTVGSTVKVATYWKNGILKKINDSTSATASAAREIVLSGSDVYLFGNKGIATACWKNGVELTPITGGNGNGLVLNNSDVYIYGSVLIQGKAIGKYWKNGVAVELDKCVQTAGMAIKGTDVYVAGMRQTTTGKYVAAYWKNGVMTSLSSDTTNHSFVTCIVLNGNDIYIGGQSATLHAIYWKNGTAVDLSTASSSGINQITFKNGDMYCMGYKKADPAAGTASYWKNNVRKDVINDPAATINSKTTAIAIVGSDIYLAGSLASIGYWKGATFTAYANTTNATYGNIKLVERY